MEYYWRLVYGPKDDTQTLRVPPQFVAEIRRKWDAGQAVHTTQGSVPAFLIREFAPTSEPYTDQKLLEGAAKAFGEPLLYEDGSIACKWVKMMVTTKEYEQHYSKLPSYKLLERSDPHVTVAFRKPVHEINSIVTPECTDVEIKRLTH